MRFALLALTVAVTTPAGADVCKVPAGWARPVPHLVGRTAPLKFALVPGRATRLTLLPVRNVTFVAKSEHKAKPGTRAGLAALDVARAGKLEIALSSATYVDLVRDGKILPSTAHRRADACTGIHKIVSFDVVRGSYILQLGDAPGESVILQATLG